MKTDVCSTSEKCSHGGTALARCGLVPDRRRLLRLGPGRPGQRLRRLHAGELDLSIHAESRRRGLRQRWHRVHRRRVRSRSPHTHTPLAPTVARARAVRAAQREPAAEVHRVPPAGEQEAAAASGASPAAQVHRALDPEEMLEARRAAGRPAEPARFAGRRRRYRHRRIGSAPTIRGRR
jgi:hypothetical protein